MEEPMSRRIPTAARHTVISTLAALVLTPTLSQSGFADTASDITMFSVDLTQSLFSPNLNTVVLKRDSGKAITHRTDLKGNPRANTFFVIANGRVYLATDEVAYDASGKVMKTVDYSRWRDMRPVQIGFQVRSTRCGIYLGCQTGQSDSRMVFTFNTKGVGVREQMSNAVVINAR
jgi:hypothetical protein